MRRRLTVLLVLVGFVLSAGIAGATPGATLWSKRDPGGEGKAVAVSPDGTRVYVAATSGGSASDYLTYAYDSGSGFTSWSSSYSGPGLRDDVPAAIAVSPSGNRVFVTGTSKGPTTSVADSPDYATVAYNAGTGAPLWSRRYDGPGEDWATAIGVTRDGSKVIVTGHSDSTGASGVDYLTIAYDAATGTTLWRVRYDGPVHREDDALSLALGPGGGRVFVTGRSAGSMASGDPAYDYATVAYNTSNGGLIWKTRYNGPAGAYDSAFAVASAPDSSRVFVTGQSNNGSPSAGGTEDDYATIAYNAASGAPLWTQRFNGAANGTDGGRLAAVTADSSKIVVSGIIDLTTPPASLNLAYGTIAYDAVTGARLWAARYGLGSSGMAYPGSIPRGLALTKDGANAYVTGTSYGGTPPFLGGTGNDWATVSYAVATGTQRWVRRFDAGENDDDTANGIAVTGTSTVFVTGESPESMPPYPLLTIAYEA